MTRSFQSVKMEGVAISTTNSPFSLLTLLSLERAACKDGYLKTNANESNLIMIFMKAYEH